MPRKFCLLSFSLLLSGCACIAQPPKTYRVIDVAETGDAGVVSSDIDISMVVGMHNFHTYKDARMRCKLVQILQFQGHPCARIHQVEDLASSFGGNVFAYTHLQGDSYYALDLRCGLGYAVSGPVTIKGSVVMQGSALDISGSGTMSLKGFGRLEKRAGKPVSLSGESLVNTKVQ